VISAFDQSLLPQLFPDRRPPILASEKFFRVFPGLFPRDEFVARGNVKGDAIVEVGFQMQLRRSTELVLKVAKFGKEVFLPFHLLGEPLGVFAEFAGAVLWLRSISRRPVSRRIFGPT
jgi:hypothetical protein